MGTAVSGFFLTAVLKSTAVKSKTEERKNGQRAGEGEKRKRRRAGCGAWSLCVQARWLFHRMRLRLRNRRGDLDWQVRPVGQR